MATKTKKKLPTALHVWKVLVDAEQDNTNRDIFFQKLKLDSGDYREITYSIRIPTHLQTVKCDGTSMWSDTKKLKTKVTQIDLSFHIDNGDTDKGNPYMMVYAVHDLNWDIYTDCGFEHGISEILSDRVGLPIKVSFTEQGMQKNRYASLETDDKVSGMRLAGYMFEKLGIKNEY